MMFYWKLAWRNLVRNRRRSLATASAIIAGYAGLNLLGGYILRVERHLRVNAIYVNRAGHLSIYKKDALDRFLLKPKKYVITSDELKIITGALHDMPQVEFFTPTLMGVGLLGNGEKSVPFLATGIEPQAERKAENHPEVLRWAKELVSTRAKDDPYFKQKDPDAISITKDLGILVGRNTPFASLSAAQKDLQLAGLSYEGDLNAVNATLQFQHSTGFALTEDTSLRAPYSLLKSLYQTEGATSVAVFLDSTSSIKKTTRQLQQVFKDHNLNLEIYPFNNDKISLFYVGTMGFLYMMAGFFVFLIFTAAALSIVNSMTIGILERGREIGTLRSIGFQESDVAWIFTREGVLLTLVSLGVGLVLTQITAALVNGANIRFDPPGIAGDMQFVLTPDVWLCVLIAIPLFLIALTSCYLVSKRLLKKSIVDLLVT
jgi:ABC-type lipoprotein release transport system permease subunit